MKEMTKSRDLPDEVIEKIVTMMPIQAAFKARALSKTWRYRFSPVRAQGDIPYTEEEQYAVWFQAKLQKRAQSLATFFPVCIGEMMCAAYDWTSKSWVMLPSLSFIPQDLLDGRLVSFEGTASPQLVFASKVGPKMDEQLIVANIFTRTWKMLPPCPSSRLQASPPDLFKPLEPPVSWRVEVSHFSPGLVRDSSTGHYKVISFSQEVFGYKMTGLYINGGSYEVECLQESWFGHVYDSRTNAWRRTKLPSETYIELGNCHFNGVVYMVGHQSFQHIVALNVEDGTVGTLYLEYENPPADCVNKLLAWDGGLLMVILVPLLLGLSIRILKVDLELRELLEVSRGPRNLIKDNCYTTGAVSIHGQCILFERSPIELEEDFHIGQFLAYDLKKNEWSSLELPLCPLCNPSTSTLSLNSAKEQFGFSCKCQKLLFEPGFDPFWQV